VILRKNYFQAVGELVLLKFDLGQIRCVLFGGWTCGTFCAGAGLVAKLPARKNNKRETSFAFLIPGLLSGGNFTVVEIRRVAQIVSECSEVGLWFARTSLAWVTLLRKSSALPNTKLRSLCRHDWFVNAGARLSAEDVNGPLPQH